MHNTRLKLATIAATTALALSVSGCGGSDADTGEGSGTTPAASASSSTAANMTDAMFATMMITHHQDGIEVTQLGAEKATTPGVKEIAQRSLDSQQAEIPQLQAIAGAGGMASPQPMQPPLMKFNEQEMAELERLSGEQFDLNGSTF